MKTLFKYLVALTIFLSGLGVLAAGHGIGEDTPRPQSGGCCTSTAGDVETDD
jgi:hypothetical protein